MSKRIGIEHLAGEVADLHGKVIACEQANQAIHDRAAKEIADARGMAAVMLSISKSGCNNVRDLREVADVDRQAAKSRRDMPAGGIVNGVLDLRSPDDGFRVQVLAADFSPLHWVALADASLEHAGKRLAAMPEPPRDLIKMIASARAALDFEEMETDG